MTTAHRATWKAARGGLQEEGSFRLQVPSAAVSAKDAPTERKLKLRAPMDVTSRQELRARLESSEAPLYKRPRKSRFGPASATECKIASSPLLSVVRTCSQESYESEDVDNEDRTADYVNPEDTGALQSPELEDKASQSDSDDDEADILAELENIRREREYERAKKQAEEQEHQEQEDIARAAVSNPLLGRLSHLGGEISDTASIATGSMPAFAVRRRWDDDVIFRSEANSERKNKQRFINDTIHNDFHRKFMKRHMR